MGQRQTAHVEAVALRALQSGGRWEAGQQPPQLRHHGQLLRGSPHVDGGPREGDQGGRSGGGHVAGTGTG